jgi:hypothetical protein
MRFVRILIRSSQLRNRLHHANRMVESGARVWRAEGGAPTATCDDETFGNEQSNAAVSRARGCEQLAEVL